MANLTEPRVEVVYRIPGQDATVTEAVPESRMEQKIKTLLKHGRKIEEIGGQRTSEPAPAAPRPLAPILEA